MNKHQWDLEDGYCFTHRKHCNMAAESPDRRCGGCGQPATQNDYPDVCDKWPLCKDSR